jgi:uncharacterized protein (DUF983 family)
MGGPSYQARRPSGEAQELGEGDTCPRCGAGVLVKVDEHFLSCTDCGFDVPLIGGEDDGE